MLKNSLIETTNTDFRNLLNNENFNKFLKLKEPIKQILENNLNVRTESQIRYSVLNKHDCPTIDAEYWQLYRELQAGFSNLLLDSFNLERINLEVEELNILLENLKNRRAKSTKENKLLDIKIKKRELFLKQKLIELETIKHIANKKMEEFLQLWDIYEEKKPQLTYSDTDPNEHQLESILMRLVLNIEALFFLEKNPDYSNLFTQLGLLKSFKEGAIKAGIYETIKNRMTQRQQNILEENFKLTYKG